MARARQLRSYSRDCFAPSQDYWWTSCIRLGLLTERRSQQVFNESKVYFCLPSGTGIATQCSTLLTASLQPNTATRNHNDYAPWETLWRCDTRQDMTDITKFHWPSWHYSPLPQIMGHCYPDRHRGRPACHHPSFMLMNLNSAVNVPMLNYHLIKGNDRKGERSWTKSGHWLADF